MNPCLPHTYRGMFYFQIKSSFGLDSTWNLWSCSQISFSLRGSSRFLKQMDLKWSKCWRSQKRIGSILSAHWHVTGQWRQRDPVCQQTVWRHQEPASSQPWPWDVTQRHVYSGPWGRPPGAGTAAGRSSSVGGCQRSNRSQQSTTSLSHIRCSTVTWWWTAVGVRANAPRLVMSRQILHYVMSRRVGIRQFGQ